MRPPILMALTALPALVAASDVVGAQAVLPPDLTQAEVKALAQNPSVRQAISACNDDRSRLCSGIFPGGGRILRCLSDNAAKASPGCRAAIDSAAQSIAAARNAH